MTDKHYRKLAQALNVAFNTIPDGVTIASRKQRELFDRVYREVFAVLHDDSERFDRVKFSKAVYEYKEM